MWHRIDAPSGGLRAYQGTDIQCVVKGADKRWQWDVYRYSGGQWRWVQMGRAPKRRIAKAVGEAAMKVLVGER